MKQSKHSVMMMVATLAASLAVGGGVISETLSGEKAALVKATPTAKSFTFCDGSTDKAHSFTDAKNVGEIHNGMMTATTYAGSGVLQLGDQRIKTPGKYDAIATWDAGAVDETATFFISAINITSVSVVAESSSYTDGTRCSFAFTGYPNSMTFTAGAGVDYAGIVGTLGTGANYNYTLSESNTLVTASGFSNVKTLAFKITAKQVGNNAHFQAFTVNWAC